MSTGDHPETSNSATVWVVAHGDGSPVHAWTDEDRAWEYAANTGGIVWREQGADFRQGGAS